MNEELTPQQEAFCRAFAVGGSAAATARAAGYAEGSARTQGWRLLQQREVRRRLNELRSDAGAAKHAFASRMFAQAEALRRKATHDGDLRTAMQAMNLQLRMAQDYGLPMEAILDPAPEDEIPEEASNGEDICGAALPEPESTVSDSANGGQPVARRGVARSGRRR
ncbi:terminase small subunit [Ferruginivarius sediminum]|uniref:Terminase small subunit n=1 Tax=Ferruginivarius sediminum TaxID=2661937 RepID=A0A369T4N8_9PROT|nr:terminase small subunit [Ferruginivarius sediminum]RDD60303.1 hypothetical protein DRB17_18875 [Ferruginivarius sediminum]